MKETRETLFLDFLRRLSRSGLTEAQIRRLKKSSAKWRNLIQFIALGCPKFQPFSPNRLYFKDREAAAEFIMGEDFVFPHEVAAICRSAYLPEQLDELRSRLPDNETFDTLRRQNFILIPGPVNNMCIHELEQLDKNQLHPDPFWDQPLGGEMRGSVDPRSQSIRPCKLGCEETVGLGWIALHKFGHNRIRTKASLLELFEIQEEEGCSLNSAQLTYALSVFHALRGKRLMNRLFFELPSRDSLTGVRRVASFFSSDQMENIDRWYSFHDPKKSQVSDELNCTISALLF